MSDEVHITEEQIVDYVEVKLGSSFDKSTWGDGPWQNEPDLEEFFHLGIRCLIRRHSRAGSFCAYVVVPVGHPWHGMDKREEDIVWLRVHGGVTFSGHLEEFYGDEYLLGCDFNHSGDFAPGDHVVLTELGSKNPELGPLQSLDVGRAKYKTIDYVRDEVKELAVALLEAAKVE